MTYLEYQTTATERTGSAYRVMALLDQLMTTDDPELIVQFEYEIADNYAHFQEFVTGLLQRSNELEGTIIAIDAEISRLEALKAQRRARSERMRAAVMRYMNDMDLTEIVTDVFTVKLRRNPPSVEVEHEALVPKEYRVIKTIEKESIDKKAIADALKNGIPVDGCRLLTKTRLEVK